MNDISMKKVIIVGATSGIGKCLAEVYAETDAKIAILGRREERLREIASTLSNKYISKVCDITDTDNLAGILDEVSDSLGGVDLIIISSGVGEFNPGLKYELEKPTLATNVLGWTCVVDWAMNKFEKQGFGHLASISSIGGLRGSGAASSYNATKAFQINYMEGMRQKANKLNKRIFTTDIRPGFVDTNMAKGEGIFWMASAEKAGRQIYNAIEKKRKIAYITQRWGVIAFILKRIPAFIYCRM